MTWSLPETVFGLIADRRRRDSGSLAVLDATGQRLTAAAPEAAGGVVGARLAAHGRGPGDRVALVLPPGVPGAAWLLGVAAFATAVPLNADLTAGDFERLFARLGVKALVTATGLNSAAPAVAQAMDLTVIDLDQDERRPMEPSATAPQPNDPLDAALILLTSGTTAEWKAVVISNASLIAKAAQYATAFALGPADRCLNVMPLYHGHGFYGGLLAPLMAGGGAICMGAFEADSFFPALRELDPTWYTASPTPHHAILAAVARDPASIAGHRIRLVNTGSGVLAMENVAALEASFGIPIVVSYGLTEAGLVSVTSITGEGRRAGSVGRPVVHPIAIVDDDGRHQPTGNVGEIAVKGP